MWRDLSHTESGREMGDVRALHGGRHCSTEAPAIVAGGVGSHWRIVTLARVLVMRGTTRDPRGSGASWLIWAYKFVA